MAVRGENTEDCCTNDKLKETGGIPQCDTPVAEEVRAEAHFFHLLSIGMSFAFLVEHLVLGRATTTSHLAFCKKKTEKKPLVTCLIYEEMTRAMPLALL